MSNSWRAWCLSCLHQLLLFMLGLQVEIAYQLLDNFYSSAIEGQPSVVALVDEADLLRQQQDLFELFITEDGIIHRCTVNI